MQVCLATEWVVFLLVLSFFRCRKLSRRLAFDSVRDGGHLCVVAVGGDEARCAWVVVCLESGCTDTLQHTATHCDAVQLTATHCNALLHTKKSFREDRHTATHCSAHNNTLHRTEENTRVLRV